MKLSDPKRLLKVQNGIIRGLAAEYRSVAEYEKEIAKRKQLALEELKSAINIKKEQLRLINNAKS